MVLRGERGEDGSYSFGEGIVSYVAFKFRDLRVLSAALRELGKGIVELKIVIVNAAVVSPNFRLNTVTASTELLCSPTWE